MRTERVLGAELLRKALKEPNCDCSAFLIVSVLFYRYLPDNYITSLEANLFKELVNLEIL